MTDEEVMGHMRKETPLNALRRVFASSVASMEQRGAQRQPFTPVEARKMEIECVRRLIKVAEEKGLVKVLDPIAVYGEG